MSISLIYFYAWTLFIVLTVLSIPFVAFWDRRRLSVEIAEEPEPEEAVSDVVANTEPEVQASEEDYYSKHIRRMNLIAEGLTQEQMEGHATATFEVAALLRNENRIRESFDVLNLLTFQPGLGEFSTTLNLLKLYELVLQDSTLDAPEIESRITEAAEVLLKNHPDQIEALRDSVEPEAWALVEQVVNS